MRLRQLFGVGFSLVVGANLARGADPAAPVADGGATLPQALGTLAQAPEVSPGGAGCSAPTQIFADPLRDACRPCQVPNMLGDFLGYCGLVTGPGSLLGTQTTVITRTVVIPDVSITTTRTRTTGPVSLTGQVYDILASRGALRIADNESPRPQDRVFFTYGYFNDVACPGAFNPPSTSFETVTTRRPRVPFGTITTTRRTTVTFPGGPGPEGRADVHLGTVGFEKTILDGNASVGVRAPLYAHNGDGSFDAEDFGDLNLILKYAFYQDPAGNVLSAGLMVTAPTGPGLPGDEGVLDSTLFQPYVGYLWNFGGFYVQGFSSVVVPTEGRDVTLALNSLGVGYFVRGSAGADRFIAPTLEVHVATPLDNRGDNEAVLVPDLVNLTGGVHFGLSPRTRLTVGTVVPVTGPRPFDIGGLVQLNLQF